MVGLKVGYLWYEIGSEDFLKSWFYSIAFHLEKKEWGSKYPVLMNTFYQGKVDSFHLKNLKKEVLISRKKLRKFKPSEVIWDIDNLDKNPPWGSDINDDITNLSNYYITSNGKDLYEVLLKAINEAINDNCNIEIKNL